MDALFRVPRIIVIGSGFSGSGAVFDYLVGRPDIGDPLNGKEFRLLHDSGGVASLHHSLSDGFSVHMANTAINMFERVCLSRYPTSLIRRSYRKIRGRPPRSGIEKDLIEWYKDTITLIEYRGLTNHDLALRSFFVKKSVNLFRRLWKIAGFRFNADNIRLPVREEEFLNATRDFLDQVLRIPDSNRKIRGVAINQGGSFWNPNSSTRYYGDSRRIIVVTRDPRDIFSEVKSIGYSYPGESATKFCSWYKEIMDRRSAPEWMDSNVLHIGFEDFVTSFQDEKKRLDSFLGLPGGVRSKYNPGDSANNIGVFSKSISYSERTVIESQLKEFIMNPP